MFGKRFARAIEKRFDKLFLKAYNHINKKDSLGRGVIPHRQSKSAKGESLRAGEIPAPTV